MKPAAGIFPIMFGLAVTMSAPVLVRFQTKWMGLSEGVTRVLVNAIRLAGAIAVAIGVLAMFGVFRA